MSRRSDNDQPPAATAATPPAYEDCMSCRLVGTAAMAGLGAYTLRVRSELDPRRFAHRRLGLLGLSAAFAGLAALRLFG